VRKQDHEDMNEPRDKGATAGDGDVLPPSWEVRDWLASMALLEAIADSLTMPVAKEDARLQLPYVRALVHEQQLRAALVRTLQDPKLQHRFAKLIADGVRQLGDATAASGEEFNSKFQGVPWSTSSSSGRPWSARSTTRPVLGATGLPEELQYSTRRTEGT